MTLNQKADEYLSKHWSWNVIAISEQHEFQQVKGAPHFYENAIKQAYLAGAEPREKQIQIDAEQIRALQKQNGELTDRVNELEAQIEKMRNCEMCGNHNWQGCVFSSEERLNCINNKRNLFELKEIKEK